MKRESLNTSIQSPHFQSRSGMLNHTGGTYSLNSMMVYPRVPITEWILEQFQTLSARVTAGPAEQGFELCTVADFSRRVPLDELRGRRGL